MLEFKFKTKAPSITTKGFVLTAVLVAPYCLGQIPGMQAKDDWQLGGYIKAMPSHYRVDNQESVTEHLLHNRINLDYQALSNVDLHLGMRNRLFMGSQLDSNLAELSSQDTGYWDLSKSWQHNDQVFNTSIDRGYLLWRPNDLHLKVGRFRINWSMNSIWNPNDIFNSYSLYDFDYDEKPGRDALSLSYHLGFATEINLVYSLRQTQHDLVAQDYGMRYLSHYQGWDWQLILAESFNDRVIGGGFAGQINGAGIRGEISHFSSQSSQNIPALEDSYSASIELDYSFSGSSNALASIAALYISKPSEHSVSRGMTQADSIQNAHIQTDHIQTAHIQTSRIQTGRELSFTSWSYYLNTSFDITSLTRLSVTGIYYQDDSYFTSLSLTHSLSDNWLLTGQIQRFDGSETSQFGQAPYTQLFAQLRWSY